MPGVAFLPGAFATPAFLVYYTTLAPGPVLEARAGVAIASASYAGDFIPNVVIEINGVDVTENVHPPSLNVALSINSEPADTAEFLIPAWTGYVPVVNQLVIIGLGTIENRILGGQIQSVDHVFEPDGEETPWVRVSCIDWTNLLNRRLVTDDYSGLTATVIAKRVLSDYTDGFSQEAIQDNLQFIADFRPDNWTVSQTFVELARLSGGAFKVDAYRRVHLSGLSGPDPLYTPSAPAALTDGNDLTRDFTHSYDASQIRNRATVEGLSTQIRIDAPAGATHIPVEHAWGFNPTSAGRVRLTRQKLFAAATTVVGPPAAEVTSAASAGAASITISTIAPFTDAYGNDNPIWAYDPDGNLFAGFVTAAAPTTFTLYATSGYGALIRDLAVGEAIYGVDVLWSIINIRPKGSGSLGLFEAAKAGETVTLYAIEDDAASQTALAAVEGGDGIHEHFIANGNLTYEGAQALADAEVAAFKDPIVSASWVTEDMSAVPRAMQSISFALTGGLTTSIRINTVRLTFPVQDRAPTRVCEAATVKLQSWVEALRGAQ